VVTFDTTWKENLLGGEVYEQAVTSADIFGGVRFNRDRTEYVRVSTSLFDARLASTTFGTTLENNPRFQVTFMQDQFASGYGGYSPITGKWEISYSDLIVSINGS